MNEIEKRACGALHEAFCRLRYLAKFELNQAGKRHMFLVADAAHNLPSALGGDKYHGPNLERDLAVLEELLSEPLGVALGRYREPTRPQGMGRIVSMVTGGAFTSLIFGCIAGVTALFTETPAFWNAAYSLLGLAVLLAAISYAVRAIEKHQAGKAALAGH